MGKFIDLTGQKFGRLIVLERSNICKKGHTTFWLCQCNCGNIVRSYQDYCDACGVRLCWDNVHA